MSMDCKKTGKFIAQLRKEKKMTQDDLAKKLFVDRTTISKWELGENNISIDTLVKISDLFDITINELILGEKITNDNIEKISSVTVDALKKGLKFKRYFCLSIATIILLIVMFLCYYFLSTYNAFMLYEISGESDEIYVENGLFFVSKEKAYITIGHIENIESDDVELTRLFYLKNGKEVTLYENQDLTGFYKTSFNDNTGFQYSDLKYVLSNLNLEIKKKNKEAIIIKLKMKKGYSNSNLFVKNPKPIKQEEINKFDSSIPEYVKENYKYDSETNSYVLNQTFDNKKILITYFVDAKVYVVNEESEDYSETYVYSPPDDFAYDMTDSNGTIIKSFDYSITEKQCISTAECDDAKIKYFEDKYLNNLFAH